MTCGRKRAAVSSALLVIVVGGAVLVAATYPSRPPHLPPPVRIAVVGGSFAAGSDNRVVWPSLLADRTGWEVVNFALSGAGLVADGEGGHAFSYQVDRTRRSGVDFVLIAEDGADNGRSDPAALRVTLTDLLNRITLAGQQPLVVGPTWYRVPVPPEVRVVSNATRAASMSLSVPFLESLSPPWLTPDLMGARLRAPTDEGQAVIAGHIAQWLHEELHR